MLVTWGCKQLMKREDRRDARISNCLVLVPCEVERKGGQDQGGWLQAELLDLVAKEKERSQSGGKKKKGKKGGKQPEKEEGTAEALARQRSKEATEVPGGALQDTSKQPSAHLREALPSQRTESQPPLVTEAEVGGWEVQPTKRRGAQQVGAQPLQRQQ